jgi:hypothetical protein
MYQCVKKTKPRDYVQPHEDLKRTIGYERQLMPPFQRPELGSKAVPSAQKTTTQPMNLREISTRSSSRKYLYI